MANPAMRYFVEIPGGAATLSASEPRLYFDLPSSAGANGPSKALVSEGSLNAIDFLISIFPDRDTIDESHTLTIRYLDGRGGIRIQTIDVHVIDQDVEQPLEFNIITDFRYDETGFFDDPDARRVVRQAADDWAYFIADMNLDKVRAGEAQMWHRTSSGGRRLVTNAIDYTGLMVHAYGKRSKLMRASADQACNGGNQTSLGEMLPLMRLGAIIFDPRPDYNTLAWLNAGGIDLYSLAMHELGHVVVYAGFCRNGFTDFYESGEIRDPDVKDYFGAYPAVDEGHHLAGVDPASRVGIFGDHLGGEMSLKGWLITKLDLLIAQAVGYILRDTSALSELSLSDEPLAEGRLGDEYAHAMGVLGGIPAYFWTIEVGELPEGLSLDSFTGTISGTPIEAGMFSFTVRVQDQTEGDSGVTRDVTLIVGN